ncbi:MAG: tetratricopeptide repeat protein [Flavobacteriales bacterium]
MQNSELKKQLLGPHKEVSAKELENYLSGKLLASEARAVEEKLHSNEFSNVAAEGFETYGNTASISEVGKQWSTPNYTWLILTTLGALVILAAGGIWYSSSQSNPVSDTNSNELVVQTTVDPEEQLDIKETPVETNTEKIVEPSPTVETIKINAEEKSPEASEDNKNKAPEEEPVLFYTGIEDEVFKLKPLSIKKGELTLMEQKTKLKTQKARLRHYKNFKLVDQGIGIDQSLLKPILNGTEPFKETIEINPKYPEWMPADSVYRASVNEAIDWILEEDYSSAKMRFKRLLENTPEDLTATFYMGYTLFLDEDYKQAIYYLGKAQAHMIQTFDQDARFIEIKCLLQTGREEEALKQAKYLKDIDSFYAGRAMELVD